MARSGSSRAKTIFGRIDSDIASVDKEMSALTTYRDGLIAARAELSKTILHTKLGVRTPKSSGKASGLTGMSRVAAVQYVLDHSDGPMNASDVVKMFEKDGRHDDKNAAVASAIGYLGRHGKASAQGHGMWVGTHKVVAAA